MKLNNTLEKAIDANRRQRSRLLAGSTRYRSWLVGGLAKFQNKPIKVYLTESGLIREVSGNPNAVGTVMRDNGGYLIFVDRECDSKIRPATENSSLRFLLLHEYAHIIHGDVFEDKSNSEKFKLINLTPEELDKYWKPAEKFANGYAAERLLSEFINESDDVPGGRSKSKR